MYIKALFHIGMDIKGKGFPFASSKIISRHSFRETIKDLANNCYAINDPFISDADIE